MRSVINISLPKELAEEVEKAVKKGKYSSKSEFFRALFRWWQEREFLREFKESQKKIALNKKRPLHSLKDAC